MASRTPISAALPASATSVLWGFSSTFAVAVLSGSGDAAAIAFNKAVLPHAAQLGMTQVNLGNIAWLGGGLGRSMSPVAAACAIAAGYAGVTVFDIAKEKGNMAITSALERAR